MRRDGGAVQSRSPTARVGIADARRGPRPSLLAHRPGGDTRVELLGGFGLVVGKTPVHLPRGEQRVVVQLALHDRPQPRSALAGRLWPDTLEHRAMACLRTAIWRLQRPGWRLIEVSADEMALDRDVRVDVNELMALARHMLDVADGVDEAEVTRLEELVIAGDLLPDWEDEWLAPERERFRQVRLHALEIVGERFAREGRFGRAVEASLAVLAADPLRESARRQLIRVHAAEGNFHEALAEYRRYREAMFEELGLEPSRQMAALAHDLGLDF
jgi:DNA-binding SARP family transcriptional activator